MVQVGQEIEVRPGIVSKDTEGKLTCKPIFSRIMSLFAEQNDLNYAVPGGLIGTLLLGQKSVLKLGTICSFTSLVTAENFWIPLFTVCVFIT